MTSTHALPLQNLPNVVNPAAPPPLPALPVVVARALADAAAGAADNPLVAYVAHDDEPALVAAFAAAGPAGRRGVVVRGTTVMAAGQFVILDPHRHPLDGATYRYA